MALPVDQVIQRGLDIVHTVPHPYYSMDWDKRLGPSAYDCSGFMGVINGIPGGPATPNMKDVYESYGYKYLIFTGLSSLKKGDVLVYNKPGTSGFGAAGHTAMYAGNGMFLECHGGYGPDYRPAWGDGYWQQVLRNPCSGIYITHFSPTDGLGGGF